MIAGPVAARTIPELITRAAGRDPDGAWLRADDAGPAFAAGGGLTFAGAAGRIGAVAAALREAGVRRGDLAVVTARGTPPYLLCWLALASLGAVTVATNPRGAPAELAGLVRQVSPRALISDAVTLTAPGCAPTTPGWPAWSTRPVSVRCPSWGCSTSMRSRPVSTGPVSTGPVSTGGPAASCRTPAFARTTWRR